MIKSKEEEIADLQVQLHDFKKHVEDSGEKVLSELKKYSRENDNLIEWLKLYDEQIKNNEKEMYNLNLRLYFLSQQTQHQILPQQTQHQTLPQQTQEQLQTQPQQSSQQPRPQLQPYQSQSQSPTFKNLADYFEYYKNNE